MDKNVLAAMARWPNVPDVFGWLSLSQRGQWRLHPRGDALSAQPTAAKEAARQSRLETNESAPPGIGDNSGESITSQQILQFINHNYGCDVLGQWFFQNGPQRVFVRLDAAPYILQTAGILNAAGSTLALQTHNGLKVQKISAWYLDETGRLYAQTEHGPGLIAGRDLMAVLALLYADENNNLMNLLEQNPAPENVMVRTRLLDSAALPSVDTAKPSNSPALMINAHDSQAPLKCCAASEIPGLMGFVRYPRNNTVTVSHQVE